MTIKSILGKMFVNDKQIVVLDDTAENGGIESGSNANGSYTKFPDGTLICHNKDLLPAEITTATLYGSIYGVGVGLNIQTFPATFIDLPVVACSPRLTSGRILGAVDFSTTTTTFDYMLTGATSTAKARPYYIAIGRWK